MIYYYYFTIIFAFFFKKSLAPMYYRGASAAIVVYDISNKSSFDTMKRWIDELKVRAPQNIVLALAGNKSDLEDKRAVTSTDVQNYIKSINDVDGLDPVFGECSAKTGDGIQELFANVCRRLIKMAEAETTN